MLYIYLTGTCDYKQPINPIYLNAIEQEMNIPHSTDCSLFVPPMFSEIAYLILAYHNLPPTQPLSLDMAIKTLNVLLRYFN